MKKIHHIGIACNNIEDRLALFKIDVSDIQETYIDKEQNNTLYFIYLQQNNLWIEVVVPLNSKSTVWNYLKRQGIGVHHIGFLSENFDNERHILNQRNGVFELSGYSLEIKSFGGKIKTLFFTVKSMIIEYVLSCKD